MDQLRNKILVIDDDLNIKEAIKEFLTLNEYEVMSVSNGQEALEILKSWTPNLILCDVFMPIMDGFKFHQIINSNKLWSSIPFFFLTANDQDEVKKSIIQLCADDFISKPFALIDLEKSIKFKIERFQKIKDSVVNFYGSNSYLPHEVNTPLNGIIGIANILINNHQTINKSDTLELYNALKISGERLNRTMQNLLLYHQIAQERFYLDVGLHSDVLKASAEIVKQLQFNYGSEAVFINMDFQKATLKISSECLSIILYELFDNALKFSKNNEVVVKGEICESEYYQITIVDHGIGFSAEELHNINAGNQFNRDVREQQGLGLGLYLSKTLVNLAEGTLVITSIQDFETRVVVSIPLYRFN